MTTQVQPQSKTVTANGHTLHYLDWGAVGQPPLLLVHGLRGHAHSWDDVAAALCEDYHVLALDQRGRGDSDWAKDGDYTTGAYIADLAGFCAALNLEKFTLMGHSMGGRNAMAFGGKYPEMLEKLVIVDVGPTLDSRGSQRIADEIKSVPEEFDSFEAAFAYMNQQNRFSSESVMRRRVQYSTRELPNGKVGWKYDLLIREQRRNGTVPPSDDLWPALPNIACPSLIVRGVETDILSAEVAQQMLTTLPNVAMVEIPQAGHMVFEDNPADFIAAVKGFLG